MSVASKSQTINVTEYLYLATRCAKATYSAYLLFEDRAQIAVIGLIHASLAFEGATADFPAYAWVCMRREIVMEHKKVEADKRRLNQALPDDVISQNILRNPYRPDRLCEVKEILDLCRSSLDYYQFSALMFRMGFDEDHTSLSQLSNDTNLGVETLRRLGLRAKNTIKDIV